MKSIRPRDLVEELVNCIRANIPVMVWGKGGIGKSSIINQVSRYLYDKNPIDFRANLREPIDMLGVMYVDRESLSRPVTTYAPPDIWPRVERDGEVGVLSIEELPNATKAMQSAMYQLILDRRLGDYYLPTGWSIIASGNRLEDRGGTFEMPLPLKSRFLHYLLEPELDDWVAWAYRNSINPSIIAFLKTRPNLLYDVDPDAYANPTPRTWHKLSQRLEYPVADSFRAAQAAVGEGTAGEFMTHEKTWRSMPDPDDIIAKPQDAPTLKEEPSILFAVCVALAFRANKKTFPAILEYTNRITPEFQVRLVRDSLQRSPDLAQTKEFNEWASKNADVIL